MPLPGMILKIKRVEVVNYLFQKRDKGLESVYIRYDLSRNLFRFLRRLLFTPRIFQFPTVTN